MQWLWNFQLLLLNVPENPGMNWERIRKYSFLSDKRLLEAGKATVNESEEKLLLWGQSFGVGRNWADYLSYVDNDQEEQVILNLHGEIWNQDSATAVSCTQNQAGTTSVRHNAGASHTFLSSEPSEGNSLEFQQHFQSNIWPNKSVLLCILGAHLHNCQSGKGECKYLSYEDGPAVLEWKIYIKKTNQTKSICGHSDLESKPIPVSKTNSEGWWNFCWTIDFSDS